MPFPCKGVLFKNDEISQISFFKYEFPLDHNGLPLVFKDNIQFPGKFITCGAHTRYLHAIIKLTVL